MGNLEKVNKGINAAKLLDDQVMVDAFAMLEQVYINDWKTSKVDDMVKRESAYNMLRALFDLKTQLQSFVDTGKIAGKQLERLQQL